MLLLFALELIYRTDNLSTEW